MSVKMRQEVERKIAAQLINDALAAGYSISVDDGGEVVLKRSTNATDTLAAMFSTDEDRLFMHRSNEDSWYGWVLFIYGNDGYDVISDYTVNLQHIMEGADKIADQYQ